jgi:hypothetical protein
MSQRSSRELGRPEEALRDEHAARHPTSRAPRPHPPHLTGHPSILTSVARHEAGSHPSPPSSQGILLTVTIPAIREACYADPQAITSRNGRGYSGRARWRPGLTLHPGGDR